MIRRNHPSRPPSPGREQGRASWTISCRTAPGVHCESTFGSENEAVGQDRRHHAFDVVRNDKIASADRRQGLAVRNNAIEARGLPPSNTSS